MRTLTCVRCSKEADYYAPCSNCGMIHYSASELGMCVRALVAHRKGEHQNETPEKMQAIYDRGHTHEAECLAAMRTEGWSITGEQEAVVVHVADDVVILGHLDGRASNDWSTQRVLEVKSPISWQSWEDAHYNGDYSAPLMSRYAFQESVYAAGTDREAVIACLEDGVVKTFVMELPPYSLEDIRKRVLSVEFMVETGVMPECNQRDFPCPFFPRVCSHQQDEVSFDPVLDNFAVRYADYKAQEKEAKERAEEYRLEILRHLADRDTVTTDTYKVTRYTQSRRNLNRKALVARLEEEGIDIAWYESTSESVALKVTSREKDDAE